MAPSAPCTSQVPGDLFLHFKIVQQQPPVPGQLSEALTVSVHIQPLLPLPAAQLDAVLSLILSSRTPCLTPTRGILHPTRWAAGVPSIPQGDCGRLPPARSGILASHLHFPPGPIAPCITRGTCSSSNRTSAACSGSLRGSGCKPHPFSPATSSPFSQATTEQQHSKRGLRRVMPD